MKLKAGYGYWEIDYYPIGGSFHRAGNEGLELKQITGHFDKYYKGANVKAITVDGRNIACDSNHIEN